MTVQITSPFRIGIVAGIGASLLGPAVPAITTDDIFNPNAPTQSLTTMLDGISSAKLIGSAIIDCTTIANIPLFTVPVGHILIPTEVIFALTAISGSGTAPAVNVGFTGSFQDYVDGVGGSTFDLLGGSVFAAGTGHVPAETLSLVGGTHSVASQITVNTTVLGSTTVNAIGTGYVAADTITLTGGVSSTPAIATVSTTQLASLSLNVPGAGYAPTNTVTLAGGTASTKGIVTVNTVKLVSATLHVGGGGTGYGNASTFNVTVLGGTNTAAATVSVTTNSSGVVTTINSVSIAGSYTVLPTLSGNAATGDDGVNHGSGVSLDLVFGIATFTLSTPGSYTVNSPTFTQFSTTGTGVGATFNAGVFGVNTVAITNGGSFTTNAASFTQSSTSGIGTGATFNTPVFGVGAYTVLTPGLYTVLPANHVALTGAGAGASFDAQWNLLSGTFAAINTVGELIKINSLGSAGFQYIPAGGTLTARVAVAATYTTYTLRCYVFGFVTAA